MDEFIGTIKLFGFNYAPQGWASCNGQLLPIAQNTALFSLIGTTYGGDGRTTFALPDLRGRAPIHFGRGPVSYPLGQKGGADSVVLTAAQLPSHNHALAPANLPVTGTISVNASLQASNQLADTTTPVNGNVLSKGNEPIGTGGEVQIYSNNPLNTTLGGLNVTATPNNLAVNTAGVITSNTGNNMPVPTMTPYVAMNYCICLQGVFPPRS